MLKKKKRIFVQRTSYHIHEDQILLFIFVVLDIRVNFDLILRYKGRVNELGEKVYDVISSLSNFRTVWLNTALYLTYNLNGVVP